MSVAKRKAATPSAPECNLTAKDLEDLAASWIDEDHARRALLTRVDDASGREQFGQPKINCAGIVFPLIKPGTLDQMSASLRRDNPNFAVELVDGKEVRKPKDKYINPPGANRLWFMPGTTMELLKDPNIPIVFTEGVKKGIALERLSRYKLGEAADKPRFIACALTGVYNWKGTIGKESNENGVRVDIKGEIPDLQWIEWKERKATIVFDSDTHTNHKVRAAQFSFAKWIRTQGGLPYLSDLRPRGHDKVGIDDLLGERGPDEGLQVIDSAQALPPIKEEDQKAAAALDKLIADAEFFRSPDGKQYATVTMKKGQRETLEIKSGRFRSWLTSLYWNQYKIALSEAKLKETANICASKAEHEGETHEVACRMAHYNDRIYLDMGDDERHAIEISGELPAPGWRVIVNPPVRFRRSGSLGTLPWPQRGYEITELRQFLNAATDDVWIPMVSWLLGVFLPKGGYPVLLLGGEEGSAKTTQMSVLRQLIDPTTLKNGDKRSFPANERDLVIAANQCHVMSYDNLSDGLLPWMSDALCRISTGGAFATRGLYSNDEEIVFTIRRPIIANGIDDIASRADLVSRSMVVSLKRIPITNRRTEQEFDDSFDDAKPRIVGSLLTIVAAALKARGSVNLPTLPRMADFATWVAGAAKAGALPFTMEEFLDTYEQQSKAATAVLFEASTIGVAIREFISQRPKGWSGTAQSLLEILDNRHQGESLKNKAWPKIPATLSKMIRRDSSTLRANGVEVDFLKEGRNKTRIISLKWIGIPEDENEI